MLSGEIALRNNHYHCYYYSLIFKCNTNPMPFCVLYLFSAGNYLTTEQKLSRVMVCMRDGQSNLLICIWFP